MAGLPPRVNPLEVSFTAIRAQGAGGQNVKRSLDNNTNKHTDGRKLALKASLHLVNRPDSMEAVWFKSGLHRGDLTGALSVVACLSLCRRDVADGLEQTMVVEPGHPFERGQFHGLLVLPGRATMDQLGFVEAINGLGQGYATSRPLATA